MQVMLAWTADGPDPDDGRTARGTRFDRAAAELVPESWHRHSFGDADWGVLVLHPADQGAYRWPTVAADGPVTAVSLGIPSPPWPTCWTPRTGRSPT